MPQSSVSAQEAVSRGMSPRDLYVHPTRDAGQPGWLGRQHHQPGLLYAVWLGGPASATCREGKGTGVPGSTCLVGLSENCACLGSPPVVQCQARRSLRPSA